MGKRTTAGLAWLLLVLAGVLATAGLFTAVTAPAWINWQWRTAVALLVGERGYRFVFVPVIVAVLACWVRHQHRRVTVATLACCAVALVLGLKPVAQAWWLGRTLPAKLGAAFGPAQVEGAPFSVARLFGALPEPVAPQEMKYAGPLRLDFFHAVGRMPAPCVVVMHGGGWFSGGHRDRRPYTAWLARQGYAVATIDYGRTPQFVWPMQKHAVLGALEFLRAHATELGIDPQRFVLLGRSAGAQLATAVGFSARDRGVRGIIDFCGPADMGDGWEYAAGRSEMFNTGWTARQVIEVYLGGTPATVPAAYAAASGLRQIGPGSPPALLLYGGVDSLMPAREGEKLAAGLSAAGRPHALVVLPWGAHGFDLVDFNSPGGQISAYSVAWFLAAVTQ